MNLYFVIIKIIKNIHRIIQILLNKLENNIINLYEIYLKIEFI